MIQKLPLREETPDSYGAWRETESIPLPPQVRERQAKQEAEARVAEEARLREALLRAAEERQREEARRESLAATVEGARRAAYARSRACLSCGTSMTEPRTGVGFSFCHHCGAKNEETAYVKGGAAVKSLGQKAVSVEKAAPTQKASLPAALSFFFPGVGQMINGQILKGLLLLGLLFVGAVGGPFFGFLLLIGRVLAAWDAYCVAKEREKTGRIGQWEWRWE